MSVLIELYKVLLFPGLSFILTYTLYAEWLSRKTVARLQNRAGPLHTGWQGILQPVAGIKAGSKWNGKLFNNFSLVAGRHLKRKFALILVIQ